MVKFIIDKISKSLSSKKSSTASSAKATTSAQRESSREKQATPAKSSPQPDSPRSNQSDATAERDSGTSDRPPRRRRRRRSPDQGQNAESRPAAEKAPEKPQHGSWNPLDFDIPVEHGKTRFHDLNLDDRIMHAIADLNFPYCTPIQAQVLPHSLLGKDCFGKAQTGTGKTAAFLIALIDIFCRQPAPEKRRNGTPRALIITPTRELCLQIVKDAEELTKYLDLNVVAVYGGMDYEKQRRQLTEHIVDIVIATPGRLLDYRRKHDIHLSHVEIMVIDEADRMLDMGFIPDVRTIIHSTPPKNRRQTLLFSATLTDDVKRLASQWTTDPVTIEIEPEQVAVDSVEQAVYIVTEEEKLPVLINILRSTDVERAILFVNRRDHADRLVRDLHPYGFDCALLSGAIPQNKRLKTLEQFKEGHYNILVATDVAGRGLHISGVSHVINYNMPEDAEDYVHRIGRTGRAGATGKSFSFATESDSFHIPDIEEYIGMSLPYSYPPEDWFELPEPTREKLPPPRRKPGGPGGRGPGGRGGGGRRPARGSSGPRRRR